MARDGIAELYLRQPGLPAGPLPGRVGSASCRSCFGERQGRQRRARRLVSQVRGQGDAGSPVSASPSCKDPGTFHTTEEGRRAGRCRRHEGAPGRRHHRASRHHAGRHQRAGLGRGARDVLEKGVADAPTFPWGSVFLFGIDKVTKFHIDTPLYTSRQTWVMNKGAYERMSAVQKKVMDDHCSSEWALKMATPWAEFEHGGIEKMKQAGHEVYKLTPEQIDAWRKANEPLIAEWAEPVKKAGYDPKVVLDELRAAAKARNSSY